MVVFSSLVGLFAGAGASITDLMQLVKLGKYVLITAVVLTALSLARDRRVLIRSWLWTLAICCILLTLVAAQQYFDWFGWNKIYVRLVAPTQYQTLFGQGYVARAIGFVGNPNELGFMFVILILTSIHLVAAFRHRRTAVAVLAVAAGSTGLLLTASRSAVAALSAGLAAYVFTGAFVTRAVRVRLALPLIVVGIGVSLVILSSAEVATVGSRLGELRDPLAAGSFQDRTERWVENLELFRSSPWVGLGPLSGREFAFAADNEWLLLARSYGVVGTLLLGFAVVAPGTSASRASSGRLGGRELSSAILVATAVFMVPAAVYSVPALMPLVLILLSLDDGSGRPRVLL
jgi:hypothetical protein